MGTEDMGTEAAMGCTIITMGKACVRQEEGDKHRVFWIIRPGGGVGVDGLLGNMSNPKHILY
jgi:hypothetical protein